MGCKRNTNAVSELIGTILLLAIAVSAFSVIYLQFTNDDGPAPQTYINIVGDIYKQNITLIHKGGESLDGDDPITFTIAGKPLSSNISKYLNDINPKNGKWDFTEEIKFNFLDETKTSWDTFLDNIDQYAYLNSQAIDEYSNEIEFLGPVYTNYRSDLGVFASVDNSKPILGDIITFTITLWCYGGDVPAAGDVKVNCTLPLGVEYISYTSDQGPYDHTSGIWHVGNIRVKNPPEPYNLYITARVNGVPYHEDTQLGIIFSGDEYTSGSISVWQNTYLNALKFALDPVKYGIIPTDESVELTVVGCGWTDPPRAETLIPPTIITMDNAKTLAQDLPSTPYPGGPLPISSAIRLITDLMSNSENYISGKKQIVLIISSGNPNCIWDETTAGGYGGIFSSNKEQVEIDTINAKEYLNEIFNFNELHDELNAITVAKTIDQRYSMFFNESIVLPQPGNIYDILHPIVDPGWVFEIDPGKEAFQEALNLILELLLNSVRINVYLSSSTTIDPYSNNNAYDLYIQPIIV